MDFCGAPMPTCSSCEEKLSKASFAGDQLRKGPDRVCKQCVAATASLFSAALSTRRFDEVSTDAQVERLRSRDANTQMDAANKLWTLTRRGSEAVDRDIAAAGAVKPLVDLLRCRSDDRAWTAAMTLQALSCRSDARKGAIADAGAIPLLVNLLRGDSADDKEVAAMVLHNLAFASPVRTSRSVDEEKMQEEVVARQRQIVESGAALPLVALLHAPEDGAREAAAATLACVVSDCDANRDAMVAELTASADAIPPLVEMLRCHAEAEGRYDAARVLRALVRRDDDAALRVTHELQMSGGAAALLALLDRLVLGDGDLADSARPSEAPSEAPVVSGSSPRAAAAHHHHAPLANVPSAVGAPLGAAPIAVS